MHFSNVERAALHLWEQLDCSKSLRLAILARYGDWAAVLATKAEPEHFADPVDYAKANLACTFLAKNPFIKGSTSKERADKARATWLAGEASCYKANERLSRHLISPLSEEMPAKFLRGVRRWIIKWLGHPPTDTEMHQRARHGPGTTFSSLVCDPTVADKISDKLSLTRSSCWYLASIVGTMWGRQVAGSAGPSYATNFVRGNRHTVVPKTALTDRSIGIEPSLNVYFQLALGSALRARLRRSGLDLNSAHHNHRKMAQESSVDGRFATLDLSNASDTLCKNLVRILFRDTGWLDRFEDLRSSHTRFNNQWHLLEKFSSMGNGYTFELETVVFLGICAYCLELSGIEPVIGHNLSVFGDDIIVPVETVRLVTASLRFCGFEINSSKSFSTGPFRESCGGDFFNGLPVRGVYSKSSLRRDPASVFSVHNRLVRFEQDTGVNLLSVRNYLLSLIPPSVRVGCRPRLGDRGLHGLPERFRWENGIRWVKTVRFVRPRVIPWRFFDEDVQLACRITGIGSPAGIETRGSLPVLEMEWVSDS